MVITADVHTLYAEAFSVGEEFHCGEIFLFLLRGFADGPVEFFSGHEFRQADHGDPLEIFLMGVVDPVTSVLPPEALQWRDYIGEIAVDLVTAFIAHLDRKSNGVQKADRCFVGAIWHIGVSAASDGDIIHFRYVDDAGCFGRQIELFVFFLVIKCHGWVSFYSEPQQLKPRISRCFFPLKLLRTRW